MDGSGQFGRQLVFPGLKNWCPETILNTKVNKQIDFEWVGHDKGVTFDNILMTNLKCII